MAPPQRSVFQWLSNQLPPPFARNVLSSTAPLKLELLSALHMYSEIEERGKALLKTRGHRDVRVSFNRFRSYMRQATTFWQAADQLPYRASPLLYYYSFMNFAKAAIFVRDPAFTFGHIHHGLSPGLGKGGLRTSTVTMVVPGVFSHLYSHVTGTPAPQRSKLSVPTLLGYVSDIRAEYQVFRLGNIRSLACRYAVACYLDSQDAFRGLIAVPRAGDLVDKRFAKVLNRGFTEVTLDQNSARLVFNISGEISRAFSIWEAKKGYPRRTDGGAPALDVVRDTVEHLGNHISHIPFDEPGRFELAIKMGPRRTIAMNEMLAIYSAMFFLGSAVRYRPEFMEGLLARKDAWMVESFIRNTPLTFLRHARNFLDDSYMAYRER